MLHYARRGKRNDERQIFQWIYQDPSLMFNLPRVGFVFVCLVFVCLVQVFKLADVSNCRVIGISVKPGSLFPRHAPGSRHNYPPRLSPSRPATFSLWWALYAPKPFTNTPYMQRSREVEYSKCSDLVCCVILSWTFKGEEFCRDPNRVKSLISRNVSKVIPKLSWQVKLYFVILSEINWVAHSLFICKSATS